MSRKNFMLGKIGRRLGDKTGRGGPLLRHDRYSGCPIFSRPLREVGPFASSPYAPLHSLPAPAATFLTSSNWLISTVPSGNLAMILSSPPMALTKS